MKETKVTTTVVCDRCGLSRTYDADGLAAQDSIDADGWDQIERLGKKIDMCAECAAAFARWLEAES